MSQERKRSESGIEESSGVVSAIGSECPIGPECSAYSDLTAWVQNGKEKRKVVVPDEDVVPLPKDQKTSF